MADYGNSAMSEMHGDSGRAMEDTPHGAPQGEGPNKMELIKQLQQKIRDPGTPLKEKLRLKQQVEDMITGG